MYKFPSFSVIDFQG